MDSTESILEKFKKQYEFDKENNKNNYGNAKDLNYSDEEFDEYKNKVDDYRKQTDSLERQYNEFHNQYKKIDEKELESNGNTKLENVKVMVKHAYCPVCGKELVSKFPVMFNPYTKEKIAKYDCECGFKANLEYAYPRIVFIDNDNKEINAFTN